MPVAIVTGASRGLGLALTRALAARGWRVVVDARDGSALRSATAPAARAGRVVALPGDVTDPAHRRALAAAAGARVDLLVNNASALGPSPRPALAAFPLGRARGRPAGQRRGAPGADPARPARGCRPAASS